jgi:hypothetical protein
MTACRGLQVKHQAFLNSALDGSSGQLRDPVTLTTRKETSTEQGNREEGRNGGNMYIGVGIRKKEWKEGRSK